MERCGLLVVGVCVCVCVRACVRACVRPCVRACVHACVRVTEIGNIDGVYIAS